MSNFDLIVVRIVHNFSVFSFLLESIHFKGDGGRNFK